MKSHPGLRVPPRSATWSPCYHDDTNSWTREQGIALNLATSIGIPKMAPTFFLTSY